MIITLPLRLITLHFSQIGFTDGLTFIFSLPFSLIKQQKIAFLKGVPRYSTKMKNYCKSDITLF